MVENIFLTEKRREVLNGTDDLNDDSRIVEKSRIRTRARMALRELQAVADSGVIDNETVFEPDEIYGLLHALTIDDTEGGLFVQKEVDEDYKREVLEAVRAFEAVYFRGNRPEPPEIDLTEPDS